MDRPALDTFTRRHRLSPAAIHRTLQLTGARPDAATWRAFAATLLRAAGLGAVGAGILFFVAANWQDCGVLGRFALLQTALLACIAVALWRTPPSLPGQAALILATLLTGGLLALFGQSYQTGADVYELFFTWAALALPFALAGLSGALWAMWWTVLNVALALLCGWLGAEHFFWRVVVGWGLDRSTTLMLPALVNLLGAGAFLWLRGTRFAAASPLWLVRYLAGLGFGFGTLAVRVVVTDGFRYAAVAQPSSQRAAVVLLFAAISAGIAFATWRAKRDVFPMALIAASWIAISTTWLAKTMRFNEVGSFFLIAFWLIAASTVTGMLLMHWVRAWRTATADAAGQGAAA
jgi:uncharacterized membrane protein